MTKIPAFDGLPHHIEPFDFERDGDRTRLTPPPEIALLTDDPEWMPALNI